MGLPVKIVDLVRRYAALAGHATPEIIFTGVRDGEKIDEELFDQSETRRSTSHPDISTVSVGSQGPDFIDRIRGLYCTARSGVDPKELRHEIAQLLPADQLSVPSMKVA
jgi:FlaA1/EpsC-like NDP-sugar epimerase